MTGHWYDDHRNLYSLANTMIEDGYEVSGVLDMLAKPWKYEDLYTQTITPAQEERTEPEPETRDEFLRRYELLLQQGGETTEDARRYIYQLRERLARESFAPGDRFRSEPGRHTGRVVTDPTIGDLPTGWYAVRWDNDGPEALILPSILHVDRMTKEAG